MDDISQGSQEEGEDMDGNYGEILYTAFLAWEFYASSFSLSPLLVPFASFYLFSITFFAATSDSNQGPT